MLAHSEAKSRIDIVLRRAPVIDQLRNEPKDKRTLVDELDCSRSTVNRAIRELETLDLVKYVDGTYVVTPLGKEIATSLTDLSESIHLQLQFEPFFRWMPEDMLGLDIHHLDGADLLLPEPGNPWAMVNHHVSVLGQSHDVKAILPLTGLHAQEAMHHQVVENGAKTEIVVTSDVAKTLFTDPRFKDMTEEMVATGRFQIFEYEDDVPCFIGLMDDIVQIGVDEEGEPRALVEADSDRMREWAGNVIREYVQQADQVSLSSESVEA